MASLLRIFKTSSEQVGNITQKSGSNLIEYEDSLTSGNDTYLYDLSYQLVNLSIVQSAPASLPAGRSKVALYCLGANEVGEHIPYNTGCLFNVSKLESDKMGQMESNLKVNYMMHNLNAVKMDDEQMESAAYKSGQVSEDLSQGWCQYTCPFLNVNKTGAALSTLKSNNVIVPLNQVLPSWGGKRIPSSLANMIKHHYEVDPRKKLVTERNPFYFDRLCRSKLDYIIFDDKTVAAADVNQVVLGRTFASLDELFSLTTDNQLCFKAGRRVGLVYNLNGAAGLSNRIATIAANGIAIDANGEVTITFDQIAGADLFNAGDILTNGKVIMNYAPINDLAAAGNVITMTTLYPDDKDFPLFVGALIRVNMLENGAGHVSTHRIITNITRAAGNAMQLTLQGPAGQADNIQPSTLIWIDYTDCYDPSPSFTINSADLVSWHMMGKQPEENVIKVDKYKLLPDNKYATSSWQKTFGNLPQNSNGVFLMNEIDADLSLNSTKGGIDKYRISFDNVDTTYIDVQTNSSMHKDRLLRSMGESLNNMEAFNRNEDNFMITELNNTANPMPMMNIQLFGKDGENMRESILNTFVKSTETYVVKSIETYDV